MHKNDVSPIDLPTTIFWRSVKGSTKTVTSRSATDKLQMKIFVTDRI